MRVLILGINYSPEQVGIGAYTGQLASYLADAGHDVTVVTGKPYYPQWKVESGYDRWTYRQTLEQGVRVWRCPLYVPIRPTGLRRIIHHFSFAISAMLPMLLMALRYRPQIVMVIAPSLLAAPVAQVAARLASARSWLHVQDFEVGAAFATGLLDGGSRVGRLARWFEGLAMSGFSTYSSISPQMCQKLAAMTGRTGVIEFRNWAEAKLPTEDARFSSLRKTWNIGSRHVALYSGNLANKQGIGIIAEAARRLRHRTDLMFVVCGEGAGRKDFAAAVKDLPNVQLHPLQPRERLGELLGLATMHLLPQLKGAADLVLPSKLTNMLASGRPVIATTAEDTGLAAEVAGCGLVTPPGDLEAFTAAIERLASDQPLTASLGRAAAARARSRWAKMTILDEVEREMRRMTVPEKVIAGQPALGI